MRKYLPLVLVAVFLISSVPIYAMTLNPGYFLYIPIQIKSTSSLVYAVASNATVTVSLMTAYQFTQFNETGSLHGIAVQNGTEVINAVLLTPGNYYLVVYSPTQTANITYFYNYTAIKPENSSTYVEEFVTVPACGWLSFLVHLSTLGSPSTLCLFGVSNETLSYEVYNNDSEIFLNTSPITFTWNYTSNTCYYTVDLPKGIYFLNITNHHRSPAYLAVAYRVIPDYVNPFLWILIQHPNAYPTGIASYGVYGNKTTYVINTSSVLGYFNISSLLAYNASQDLVPAYSASLQLNSVLVVNNTDNSTWILWPQNVLFFVTNESVVLYHDNVFNMTDPQATLTNQSIKGDGYVEVSQQGGYYYGNYNSSPCLTYSLPFAGYLQMNESVIKGKGVLITFSVIVDENGTSSTLSSMTFDKVLVVDPNVSSAYFQVNGRSYTPAGPTSLYGSYYDTELIFGGGGSGEITTFKELSAVLGLFYLNNGKYVEFPSYYTFGGDTAEATDNVHVTFTPKGLAELSIGTPDLTYVTVSKSPLVITSLYPTVTHTSSTTTATSSTQPQTTSTNAPPSTSITKTASSTIPQTTAEPQTSSNNSSLLSIPISGLVVAGVLLAYYALKRRK
ncbi:thermopsin [Stygiolobus caldivivus]|uniref:Thermopsin n=1 Tax=Stygiolobus caldivivus TaxID=2824673 RepID=A0A8D5UA97_9CREN|nr:thermopsin [Stygiolobus caldivivus]BCU71514.1 hypothetical protein KN1_28110 [Stygiolobus caldivivus]